MPHDISLNLHINTPYILKVLGTNLLNIWWYLIGKRTYFSYLLIQMSQICTGSSTVAKSNLALYSKYFKSSGTHRRIERLKKKKKTIASIEFWNLPGPILSLHVTHILSLALLPQILSELWLRTDKIARRYLKVWRKQRAIFQLFFDENTWHLHGLMTCNISMALIL